MHRSLGAFSPLIIIIFQDLDRITLGYTFNSIVTNNLNTKGQSFGWMNCFYAVNFFSVATFCLNV